MEKLTFNNEQLEFLKFIVQDFEYNDDHEKYMIEQIENKGGEGIIGKVHNRILDVHYQNSDGIVPVQEVAHRHFRKDLDLL